jgi:hypothetical protein
LQKDSKLLHSIPGCGTVNSLSEKGGDAALIAGLAIANSTRINRFKLLIAMPYV